MLGHNASCFLTARGKSQWTLTWYNDTTVQCPLRFVVPTIVTTLSFTYHYSNNLVCRIVNHSDLSNTGIFGISSDNFNFTHRKPPLSIWPWKRDIFWKVENYQRVREYVFQGLFCWRRTFFASTTWTPTSYEWHYSPCKWPYKWVFLGLRISTYNSGLGPPWGLRFHHHWKHPLCPRSNSSIKEDMEKYKETAWAMPTWRDPTNSRCQQKITVERWIRGDLFVQNCCKNSLNFGSPIRRVNTRFFTGEIPKIPLNLLKNGRVSKTCELPFCYG